MRLSRSIAIRLEAACCRFQRLNATNNGLAVELAVLAAQRSQLKGYSEPNLRPHCASGTWHATGEAIEKAVQAKQLARLLACPSKERRARMPDMWRAMYEEAMEPKRKEQARFIKATTEYSALASAGAEMPLIATPPTIEFGGA